MPRCAPIRLPSEVVDALMSEPVLTMTDWVAVKYPSLKSICFARSGVIEKDEADMSKRPWAMLTMMVSNGCLMNSTSVIPMPGVAAMAFTRSTSKPMASVEPGSVNSNGAYGMSDATWSFPGSSSPRSAAAAVEVAVSAEPPSSSSPQAESPKVSPTATSRVVRTMIHLRMTPLHVWIRAP